MEGGRGVRWMSYNFVEKGGGFVEFDFVVVIRDGELMTGNGVVMRRLMGRDDRKRVIPTIAE